MARLDDVADTVAETADGIAAVSAATDEQATTSEAVAQRCETVSDRAAAIEATSRRYVPPAPSRRDARRD